DYNSVDAALWFVHALDRFLAYTKDRDTAQSLYPGLREILTHYETGTRFGIKADRDGLLAAGEPGVQLTWMDAKIGDHVGTPRIGKPVEINALWYNALRIGAEWANRFGSSEDAAHWTLLATRVEAAFNARFWYAHGRYLHDVVDADHCPGVDDSSLRPNQ